MVSTDATFHDVKSSDYYYKAVYWAKAEGVVNGTSATTFSPNRPCTVGQTLTFLWNFSGRPDEGYSTYFVDVPESKYYSKAVEWAYNAGIIETGPRARLFPDETCSRSLMADFMRKFLEYNGLDTSVERTNYYSDVPAGTEEGTE